MQDIKSELKNQLKVAKRMLLEDGGLAPVLFITTDDAEKKDIIVPIPLEVIDNSDYKRGFIRLIGTKIRETVKCNILGVALVSEAWVGSAKSDAPPVLPVREDPKKREAIIINFCSHNLTTISLIQYFTRDGDKIIFGKNETHTGKATVESNMLAEAFTK